MFNVPNTPEGLDDKPVRHNCAYCGRERTVADDNHHPACSYWHFFGDMAAPCPCWKCTEQPNPRAIAS
jgi:hypothetical protein